jgi:hypothetical protein
MKDKERVAKREARAGKSTPPICRVLVIAHKAIRQATLDFRSQRFSPSIPLPRESI